MRATLLQVSGLTTIAAGLVVAFGVLAGALLTVGTAALVFGVADEGR